MNMSTTVSAQANYGIDAPGVVRNLLIIGAAAWLVWAGVALNFLPNVLTIPLPGITLAFPLTTMGIGAGVLLPFLAGWMLWEAKIGKLSRRDWLLSQINWTGNERVLDIGCGRGLLLIGAAKRLTAGRATGIDLWQNEDLSDNRPDATMDNARCEGVADRVDVQTADMRELPFADNSFDVIVSRAAIHNVYNSADRVKVIADIARVLKPGGYAVIEDIRFLTQYTAQFKKNGCTDVKRIDSRLFGLLMTILTYTSLRPGTIVVRKA